MADSKLDMALDDIISKKKTENRGARRGGRPSGGGGGGGGRSARRGSGGRGGSNRFPRSAPYPMRQMNAGRWAHDMFRGGDGSGLLPPPLMGGGGGGSSGSTKLNITNLDFGVTDSDIRELFQEFGDMRSAAVHYDRSGRSLGSAQVIFGRQSDAMKAVKQYNGVHLDGRPMKIHVEGSDMGGFGGGAPYRPMSNRLNQRGGGGRVGGGGGGGRSGGGGRGRGGSRGGGRSTEKAKPKTAEELDAELDSYLTEAKKAK